MSLISDCKTLWHLAFTRLDGPTHAARLEHFYRGQADGYDGFRRRLLQGREELMGRLDMPARGVWVDLGGGTGANLEFASDRIGALSQVYVVDLCRPLLAVADQRIRDRGWKNVSTVLADATAFRPPEPVDLVTFSYSLTMIPDWAAAIDRAVESLKPGGLIGVVDFYVSRKHADSGRTQHGWSSRSLLPLWFGADNVFLSADHLPYLSRRSEPVFIAERRARIPYLPFVKAPYYLFCGRATARGRRRPGLQRSRPDRSAEPELILRARLHPGGPGRARQRHRGL